MEIFKKIAIFAAVGALGYFILAYHYIVIDNSVSMLKKSKLTLQYTIFSTKGKPVEKVLSIPELWNDGVGELLVEKRKISEDQLEMYKQKMEEEEYY